MIEIVKGLMLKLDVSLYSSTEFDYLQMEQIRLGLVDGLDVKYYLNPTTPYEEMEIMRLKLKEERNAN